MGRGVGILALAGVGLFGLAAVAVGVAVHDLGAERINTLALLALGVVALGVTLRGVRWIVEAWRTAENKPVVERQIVKETVHHYDGRLPGQPQVLTLPGAYDRYPAEFGRIVEGGRVDGLYAHQVGAPIEAQAQLVDVDAIYTPAEW